MINFTTGLGLSKRMLAVVLIFAFYFVSCTSGKNGSSSTRSVPEVNADKLVYELNGNTTTGGTLRELYMVYANGTNNIQLSFANDGDPKYFFGLSPDGHAVYQYGNNLYSVPIANPSPATTRQITANPTFTMTPHAISADSKVIYSDGWVLYITPADGSQAPAYLNSGNSGVFLGLTSNNLVVFSTNGGLYARDPAAATQPILLSSVSPGAQSAVVTGTKVVYADTGASLVYVIDTATASPAQMQLDTGSILDIAVAGEYVFYSKWNTNFNNKLWRAKLDGSDTLQLTTSLGSDDRFAALDSNNRVIYQKRSNSQDDLYSISITGGIETPLAANPAVDDTFKGLASGNRVIIETAENQPFYTITSIKSDGSDAITLATGTTGPTCGGRVEMITPDGWVVYQKWNDPLTMTSVRTDNSASGSFSHIQGRLGLTSDNRIIATLATTGSDLNLYSVLPSGMGPLPLNTVNELGWDELMTVIP